MSPRRLVTRERYIAAGRQLLDEGRILTDVPLRELMTLVGGVSMTSFYSPNHFPGGAAEWYAACISDWSTSRLAFPPGAGAAAVRDPRAMIRLIRDRWVAAARSDGALRQLASRAGRPGDTPAEAGAALAAAAAVVAVDDAVIAQVREALEDLGLAGEAAAVADEMVRGWIGRYSVAVAPAPAEAGGALAADARVFDIYLGVIADGAEARQRAATVATVAGDAAGETGVLAVPPGTSPGEWREFLAEARQFMRDRREQASPDQPRRGDPPAGA